MSARLPSYECSNFIPPYPPSVMCMSGWSDGWELGHWAFGMGWDQVPPKAVAHPFLPYDNYNFIKDGGYQGTVSSLAATADGYGFGAVFNAGDNTAPPPQDEIFWPGCSTGTPPQPAASSNNCALQAAYNHTASSPWSVNFLPQYSSEYSLWKSPSAFATYLQTEKTSKGLYPSRIEGKAISPTVFRYRARLGKETPAPEYLYGKSCAEVLAAIKSAPAATPLVSLQRFAAGTSYLYQAVWAPPIP